MNGGSGKNGFLSLVLYLMQEARKWSAKESREKAKMSDQVETPVEYWWLADNMFWQTMEAVYDLAILERNWTAEAYFNLLKEDFSSVFNYLNFPYSQGQSHLLWCCYQMVEVGANIICIGPSLSLFSKQCAKLVKALTFTVPAGKL